MERCLAREHSVSCVHYSLLLCVLKEKNHGCKRATISVAILDEFARACCLAECYGRLECRQAVNNRCYQSHVTCATGQCLSLSSA